MATILYMGKASEFLGLANEDIPLPRSVTDSISLRQWLNARAQSSGEFLKPTLRLCIDHNIVKEPCPISDDFEIAFLPPVGGG